MLRLASPLDLGSGCQWEWSLGDVETWNVQGDYRLESEGEVLGIVGGTLWHPLETWPPGLPVGWFGGRPGMCAGSVSFTRPLNPSGNEAMRPLWTVNSLEPLDISPSVLCSCGFHGFIRQGRWITA